MTIKAMIVDDEPLARANLKAALDDLTDWQIISELDSGDQVVSEVIFLTPDVLFLDIRMPGKSGIDVASDLVNLDKVPLVVFITAYDKHAIEAFELCALDYLLKPFDDVRLEQSIKRISETVEHKALLKLQIESLNQLDTNQEQPSAIERFMVKSIGKVEIIDVDTVNWIRSAGNYVELHLDDKMVLHRVSLSYLIEHLPKDFIRCHRTSIIRVSQVKEIKSLNNGKYQVIMKSGDEIPLTPTYREELLNRLS